jgi:hypothetical protein
MIEKAGGACVPDPEYPTSFNAIHLNLKTNNIYRMSSCLTRLENLFYMTGLSFIF